MEQNILNKDLETLESRRLLSAAINSAGTLVIDGTNNSDYITVSLKHGDSSKLVVSDNGNTILDWIHGAIEDPASLEKQLKTMTGVVDSGIFAGVAKLVIVAGKTGIRRIAQP